jgi:hypothetical protein
VIPFGERHNDSTFLGGGLTVACGVPEGAINRWWINPSTTIHFKGLAVMDDQMQLTDTNLLTVQKASPFNHYLSGIAEHPGSGAKFQVEWYYAGGLDECTFWAAVTPLE